MRNTTIRWAIYLFCLLVAGPAAGTLVGSIQAVDGGPASPLVSSSPLFGLGAALVALAIAGVIGVIGSRILGLLPGMTAAGLVVAWATWRTADVDQLIRTSHSAGPLSTLAVEGAILGIAGFLLAVGCWRFARHHDPDRKQSPGTSGAERSIAAGGGGAGVAVVEGAMFALAHLAKRMFAGKAGLAAMAVGLAAGGVAAWLIGASPLKGQAVFAAIAAGTFAAAACRLADYEAPIPAMFLPLILLAILGPLSGVAMAGSGGVVAASYKGTLFPLANISPLDWIAGGLLGIPLGVSWAGSMIEKRVQEA